MDALLEFILEIVFIICVIINAFEKDSILVSCEMNPLGGWSNRRLSLEDGKEIKEV